MKKTILILMFAIPLLAQQRDSDGRGLASTTFANLGTPANGTILYCSDCTAANPTGSGGAGVVVRRENGAWNGSSGGSGVTSIATTSPITGGTITTTGTIACATCVTSASALTSNLPVIGGGGQATSVGTRSGNTTAFVTTTGSLTNGHCADWDASGNLIDAGAACGGTGGGTVVPKTGNYTFLSGDSGNYYTFNGSSLTAQLVASPPTMPWIIAILNLNASNLTIDRNGNNINGAAANLTLAQNQSATCASDTVTGGNYVCALSGSGSGSGTVNTGTAGHLGYYATSTNAISDMGADFTFSTHTLTGGASSILDLSAASVTAGLKIPSAAGAAPTADGFLAVNTTNHTHAWGSNGTTLVGAVAATGTGTATTCTNQVITAVSGIAAPTCTTLTLASAMFANQGTTTQVLHGNGAGNPSFGAIVNGDITTGTIALTKLDSTTAADTVIANFTGGAASPSAVAMPTSGTNGCAGAANALTYNTTTHALGCNTISVTGGGTVVQKTANYTLLSGDTGTYFVFNGASLTATLPASPPTMPWIVVVQNNAITPLTIGRNGNNINAVAQNRTVPPGSVATCASDTVTGSNYTCAINAGFSEAYTLGTVTAGDLACFTASDTVGNCGANPTAILGVFSDASGAIAVGGTTATVALDATQNVTFNDIVCVSSTTNSVGHDNGSTPCTNAQWVGIVQHTASSVSSATVLLRLQ